MRLAIITILFGLGLAAPQSTLAQDGTEPASWGQALREDAKAFHDLVAENHPGPIDDQNPAFSASLEEGLTLALDRARTADSYSAWRAALAEYAAAFNDGHLGLKDIKDNPAPAPINWPGFLVGLRSAPGGDHYEVAFNRDPAAPPVGAVLVSCDGRPAEALAQEMIGREAGRWSLRSTRVSHAVWSLVDTGNPYVRRPERCDFTVNGRTTRHALSWRPLDPADREAGIAAASGQRFTASTALRPWDAGLWIELGDFGADPRTPEGQKLTALLAEAETRVADLRAAPVLVFDLRGNNGGSSTWLSTLARTIWGADYADAHTADSSSIDWRASPDNLAKLEEYRTQFSSQPDTLAYVNRLIDGMSAAMAAGSPLFHEADDAEPERGAAPANPVAGKVYVLTDYGCASACLDAVDTLTALGAVQVGQETSADTLYMEIRYVPLPSGRATAYVPMKVYRNRARANNQTAVPRHAWTGALTDTAALERWIAQLAGQD